MSRFLKDWLTSSNEAHDEKQKVVVQDGETPKEDFSDASNEQSGDADTSKPAVAELDAASDGAVEPETKDQGHQKVTVSAEDSDVDDEQDESEEKDDEDAEETPDAEEEAGEAAETAEDEAESAENGEGGVEEGEGTEEEEGAAEETTDAGAVEVEEVKEEVSEDDDTQDEPVEPAEGEAVVEAEAGEAEGDDVPAEGAAEEAGADNGEEDVPAADEGEGEETVPATGEESVEDNEPAPAEGDVPAADGDEVAEAEADAQGEDAETGDVNEGPTQDVPESEGEVSADADDTATAEGEVEGDTVVSTEADESLDVGITTPEEKLVEEMDQVADDAAHFEKVSESLEAYHTLLSKALADNNGIDAITAESIRIGLEHMDESFAGDQLIPGMEAFGQTSSRHVATKVSMESIASGFKATVEAGKRAMLKLFDLLYELWTKMTGGVARAQERAKELDAKIRELDATSVGYARTTVKGKARLSRGVEFVGNDVDAIRQVGEVADYMYGTYPAQVTGLIKDAIKVFKDGGNVALKGEAEINAIRGRMLEEFLRLPKKHFKPVPGSTTANPKELPPSIAKYVGVTRSHVLPGNFALMVYLKPITSGGRNGNEKTEALLHTAFNFDKVFNIEFGRLNVKADTQNEETYGIPDKKELINVSSEVRKVLTRLERASAVEKQYKELKNDVKKHHDEVVKASSNVIQTMDPFNKILHPGVMTLNALTRKLVHPAGQFNGYVVSTMNAFLSVLEHNLKEFTKAAKPADAEDGKYREDHKALPAGA